jgi:hypothetical protein
MSRNTSDECGIEREFNFMRGTSSGSTIFDSQRAAIIVRLAAAPNLTLGDLVCFSDTATF